MRFEKTSFGYRAYRQSSFGAYVYFGHFYTKAEAKRVFAEFKCAQVAE